MYTTENNERLTTLAKLISQAAQLGDIDLEYTLRQEWYAIRYQQE